VALLLETGLLLVLVPWSAFWDRNYFTAVLPILAAFTTNHYVRGAVTGLGLLNLWVGLAELADLVVARRQPAAPPDA
jgi:hypothetical protein